MCHRVTCRKCGKPTYAGCGAHIEIVLAGVPRDQRCRCREERAAAKAAARAAGHLSWWERLLPK